MKRCHFCVFILNISYLVHLNILYIGAASNLRAAVNYPTAFDHALEYGAESRIVIILIICTLDKIKQRWNWGGFGCLRAIWEVKTHHFYGDPKISKRKRDIWSIHSKIELFVGTDQRLKYENRTILVIFARILFIKTIFSGFLKISIHGI